MILIVIHRICYNGIHTISHTICDYIRDIPLYGHGITCCRILEHLRQMSIVVNIGWHSNNLNVLLCHIVQVDS